MSSRSSARHRSACEPQFTDIGPDDPRLAADILPVLRELPTHLTAESLASIYAEGYPQGLRFTGAYIDSACLGVAGWRIVATTSCKLPAPSRSLWLPDVYVQLSRPLGPVVLNLFSIF
jgi:hypothetical protein